MIVRRLLGVAGLAVIVGLMVASPSGAAPSATFSSPTSSPAGAPMWIKSVTPCPGTPADHIQFVAAWVVPQEDPNGAPVSSVYGDVDKQGVWRVTLPAPNDVQAGASASYFIRANCVVRDPYPTGAPAPDQISQQYAIRALMVTSTGGAPGGGGPAIPGTTTTTSTTTSTTTTTTVPTTTTTTALGGASFEGSGFDASRFDAAHNVRLDGDDSGDVSLDALPAAGTRAAEGARGSDVGGMMIFAALLLGLGVGGWQLARFTKR
jgi:hypothetical protein